MKKITLYACLLICAPGFCQDLPSPEFAGRPYFVKENSLVNFERADGALGANTSTKGMVTFYGVPKDKSDVRFTSSALPRIIIKVDAGVDPSEVFSVVRAEVGKKGREFTVRKTDRKNNPLDVSDVQVKVSATKVSDGIYELKFENGIPTGEYAIVSSLETNSGMALKSKLSCFGID